MITDREQYGEHMLMQPAMCCCQVKRHRRAFFIVVAAVIIGVLASIAFGLVWP